MVTETARAGACGDGEVEYFGGLPEPTPTAYPGDFGNPNVAPGPGWEWIGNGDPDSEEGNWYNRDTGESWHPHLKPNQHGPHWDYQKRGDPNEWRYFQDGRWELKW